MSLQRVLQTLVPILLALAAGGGGSELADWLRPEATQQETRRLADWMAYELVQLDHRLDSLERWRPVEEQR